MHREARLGLKPIVRRVWSLKGKRPLAFHHTRYEWLYVYLFVHPKSGRSTFLILPTVNTELMSLALQEFQREVDRREGRWWCCFWTTRGGTVRRTFKYHRGWCSCTCRPIRRSFHLQSR